MRKSPSRRSAASGADHGCRRAGACRGRHRGAFAYRSYVGSPRSGEPPIIKADNSPTKVVPTPGDGAAPRRRTAWRPAMAAKSSCRARRRRSTSIRRSGPARGVSAAEPERQPAVGRERLAGRAAAGDAPQRHAAEQRAAPDQDACRSRATPTTAALPQALPPPAKPAAGRAPHRRRHRRRAPAPRNPPSANASANAPLSLSPQGARRARSGRRPGWPPSIRRRPRRLAAGGGYVVQVSSQKNEADAQASYRALQGKYRPCWAPARPSIRRADLGEKGVVLPRHGRPVRLPGGGGPVLRQSENRRRAVRRPKELTARFLDPGAVRGLIGPHEQPRIHHRHFRTGTDR